MNRDKQIGEMARVIKSSLEGLGSGNFNFTGDEISAMFAEALYNAGYRKASDGAREIFEEADKIFMDTCLSLEAYGAWFELKKKYTEVEG